MSNSRKEKFTLFFSNDLPNMYHNVLNLFQDSSESSRAVDNQYSFV